MKGKLNTAYQINIQGDDEKQEQMPKFISDEFTYASLPCRVVVVEAKAVDFLAFHSRLLLSLFLTVEDFRVLLQNHPHCLSCLPGLVEGQYCDYDYFVRLCLTHRNNNAMPITFFLTYFLIA